MTDTLQSHPRDNLTQHVFLKDHIDLYDFLYMHPILLSMLAFTINFCLVNNIKCVITDIFRPPNDGISVSKTHQEMRAFDISFKKKWGWNSLLIREFEDAFYKEFSTVGAISHKTGKSTPIKTHDTGSGLHGHCQIRPGLKGFPIW